MWDAGGRGWCQAPASLRRSKKTLPSSELGPFRKRKVLPAGFGADAPRATVCQQMLWEGLGSDRGVGNDIFCFPW